MMLLSSKQKQGAISAMSRSEIGQIQYVDNTYHDFSRFLERGGQIIDHKKSLNNFPKRLHLMLSNPQFSHVITWMPHGRCWKVLDRKLLIEEGNPRYLSQNKFESFTRQLSSWGFKRLRRPGRDKGCYYHERFLRGLPRLTELMRRVESQGKPRPCLEGEPDFYSIAMSHPLPPNMEETVAHVEATLRSVPSKTSTYDWNINETTSHSSSRIASDGATAVATSMPRTNVLKRSTSQELMSGLTKMASLSPSSSIPGSASAATSATQSSAAVYHDLQVQSHYLGETNRPHPQQELSSQSYFPLQAPLALGESDSYLHYQYQTQASASNNNFRHHQPHSLYYQMDSPYFSYPETYASTLASSSGDWYAQDNNSGSNVITHPSEEVLPRPNSQPYYKQGLGWQDDYTEARVIRFFENFELQEQQHGGTETNYEGQEDESSNSSVNSFIENFEF